MTDEPVGGEPHHFTINVHMQGHGYDWGSQMIPQEIRAFSLVEALRKATEIPLSEWFPSEETHND